MSTDLKSLKKNRTAMIAFFFNLKFRIKTFELRKIKQQERDFVFRLPNMVLCCEC